MITTNLGFADWTQIFGDAVMTARNDNQKLTTCANPKLTTLNI
jgi:hypothetical protein